MNALEVRSLSKNFGGVEAVSNVSFSVASGERRVLIGPNGAGKTTLFHCIAGTLLPTSGGVTLFGKEISQLAPYARAHAGLGRTFQITNLLSKLTVWENVLLAVAAPPRLGLALMKPMTSYRMLYKRTEQLLADFRLSEFGPHQVHRLSYGVQRQLELVLALASAPRLLLLDEPTAGLSASESALVVATVRNLPRDITILMIDHDMDVAFELADQISVLHQGRMIVEGDRHTVQSNAQVNEIYLGGA